MGYLSATRVGDFCTGHDLCGEVPLVKGENSVFFNGKAAGVVGSEYAEHWDEEHLPHSGKIISGAPNVFINGKHAARVGDAVSCGGVVKEGSPNIFIGVNDKNAGYMVNKAIVMGKYPTEADKTILCLPEIAEAEAGRQSNAKDAQGWLYLSDMFKKWIGGKANDNPYDVGTKPFYVDMDWVRSYPYAEEMFQDAVIRSRTEAARNSLIGSLRKAGLLTSKREEFDFIKCDPHDWKKYYHQYSVVSEEYAYSGLLAAMGGFAFYCLASGYVEPCEGGCEVTVINLSVAVHDVFNFEGDANLRYWNCEEKNFTLLQQNSRSVKMTNEKFRSFREEYGIGRDFLVVSQPTAIENFSPFTFRSLL